MEPADSWKVSAVTELVDRERAWAELAAIEPRPRPGGTPTEIPAEAPTESSVETDAMAALPPPAARFLERCVPADLVEIGPVVIEMEGEIKLKRWMPFTARQLLAPGHGFVWNASVGRLVRFQGGDTYWQGRGSLQFRLAGVIPVVRAAGPDVARSAIGRLAAETVAWAPEALFPSSAIGWRPIDETSAIVSQVIGGTAVDVTIRTDGHGVIDELVTMRVGTPPGAAFGTHPFGGSVTRTGVLGGVTRAIEGTVGWWWGTDRQEEGEFFRYRLLDAAPARSNP